jgi:dsDNA-binding SOS-regulon protein
MAIATVWKCNRDGTMFEDKKEAEAHDKMLELAEGFADFLKQNIAGLDEQLADEVGRLLAGRRDDLLKACKGSPEVLRVPLGDDEEDRKVATLGAGR